MDPRKTRAFVVGIERYELGAAWNGLSGPVADAYRFARWLVERGVEPAGITAFVDPPSVPFAADVPPLDPGIRVLPPNFGEFRAAVLGDLATDPPEMFLLYWSGHGVMDHDRRYLPFGDAQPHAASALDPEELRRFLATLAAPAGKLARIAIVIDACSDHARIAGIQGKLTNLALPGADMTEVPGRKPFVLAASRKGERAANDIAAQAGCFTTEFLAALPPGPGVAWPPDFDALGPALRTRFKELGIGQSPAYYAYETPDGGGEFRSSESDADLEPLWDAFRRSVPPVSEAAVRKAFFLAACEEPRFRGAGAESLFVAAATRLRTRPGGALLRFVECLRPLLGGPGVAATAGQWQRGFAATEGLDLDALRAECAPGIDATRAAARADLDSVVQIVVEPLPTGGYRMRTGRRLGMEVDDDTPAAAGVAETPDELGVCFQKLFPSVHPAGSPAPRRIEFALPFELYGHDAADWSVRTGQNARRQPILGPVGRSYPVVLRSYDLSFDESGDFAVPRGLRQVRCPLPDTALPDGSIIRTDRAAAGRPGATAAWRQAVVRALAAVDFDPDRTLGGDQTLATELTNSGLPLAVWIRGEGLDPAAAATVLGDEVLAHPPTEWPARVHRLRGDLPAGWAGITLLWDPHEVPLPPPPNRTSHPAAAPRNSTSP